MKLWLFRIVWGIDAAISAVVVWFFFLGIANGSVSSFNIGLWSLILFALAAILGGSLWLKKTEHQVLGILLLLVLALPGLLYGVFIVLLLVTNTSWN